MRLFIQYFCLAVILQLIFSELLTINGFQPNIMLLFVILSQMSQPNTSKAVIIGFLVGLVCDLVLFSGTYLGLSSLVFSICAFIASRIRFNFVFQTFDLYWITTLLIGIVIYCLFRYDFLFFSDFFLFLKSVISISLYSVFVSFILVKVSSIKRVILSA
ncbi:MAG: rod shape-determining protein MreD [Candidatus Neomarinimicrobiota bacterium]|nr:rod shape-determining protein MreD [Candidatus Neomarinimicrobiota bacterium]MEC8946446.1 rod shape-determining protein MreD [Candidatus Neomarinimicrobiota bacterium]MEC9455614.1 rod shape-determining protein MreD [Candidatus Neomarinimicrobiota bacterium]